MTPNEANYLATVNSSHRKAFGQYFTPPEVARFMAEWVMGSGQPGIHDPGFGLGAFLDATSGTSNLTFTGSEVDQQILEFWSRNSANPRALIERQDYLISWGKTHSNIVCNPPYLRFQRFPNRKAVLEQFERRLGTRLAGYINTASAFLVKSLSELEPGGRLAYIMPLEFLNTGYGSTVKERLIANAHVAAIISLDCERGVFPDATTSIGIVLYDSSREYSHLKLYRATSVKQLKDLFSVEPSAKIPYAELAPSEKWLPYFDTNPRAVDRQNVVPLEHYGRFSRGIATGANEFFALKPSLAMELGLGGSEVIPVITKSAQVSTPFFSQRDYDNLKQRDERVLLFSAQGQVSEKAQNYIWIGEQRGYQHRFITRNRSPWYKTESRQPAPLLLGVFSRGGYKIVRNESNALNLTCFHGFRPNLLGLNYIDHLFLYLSSNVGREILSLSIRKYGDSLDKFEPNDLNAALAPAPEIFDRISVEELMYTLNEYKRTGQVPSRVESWFRHIVK